MKRLLLLILIAAAALPAAAQTPSVLDPYYGYLNQDTPIPPERIDELKQIYQDASEDPGRREEAAQAASLLFLLTQRSGLTVDFDSKGELSKGYAQKTTWEDPSWDTKAAFWSSLGIAAAGLIGFNTFWYLSDKAYDDSMEQTTREAGGFYQMQWQLYDTLAYVFAGTGTGALALMTASLAMDTNTFPGKITPGPRAFPLPDLKGLSPDDQLKQWNEIKTDYEIEREQKIEVKSRIKKAAWSLGGIGAAAATTMGICLGVETHIRDRGVNTDNLETIKGLQAAALSTGISGGLLLLAGGITALFMPNVESYDATLEILDAKIAAISP